MSPVEILILAGIGVVFVVAWFYLMRTSVRSGG